jgi:hypothetical protein
MSGVSTDVSCRRQPHRIVGNETPAMELVGHRWRRPRAPDRSGRVAIGRHSGERGRAGLRDCVVLIDFASADTDRSDDRARRPAPSASVDFAPSPERPLFG